MTDVGRLLAVVVVSAAGTALARAYALRRRLVDEPGARRSHVVATPRGGGAGPVIAILAWMLATRETTGAGGGLVALALAAVALIGAWDDHRPLPASWRLLVHLAAGIAVATALAHPAQNPVVFVLTVGVVVGLVNVWNFMDGIDGIAATQAALVAFAFAAFEPAHGAAALAIAAACLGFLPFNFPRARIFLGDVGSGALGLVIAWLWSSIANARAIDAALLALPVSAFLVDASLTLLRRVLRRERWWEPHAQHLFQALARRHGHVPVTLAYAAWTLLASIAMLALREAAPPFTMASVALCYTTAALLWLGLQRHVAMERDARTTRDQ